MNKMHSNKRDKKNNRENNNNTNNKEKEKRHSMLIITTPKPIKHKHLIMKMITKKEVIKAKHEP